MNRTSVAALVAAGLVGLGVGGLGVFLGFQPTPAWLTGAVLGGLAGLLLWGASRRAETFHPTDPNAHLADHGRDAATSPPETDPESDTPPAGA